MTNVRGRRSVQAITGFSGTLDVLAESLAVAGLGVLHGAYAVGLDALGLLTTKFEQALFMVFAMSLFIGAAIWNVKTIKVGCPRCGWNIFFSKDLMMLTHHIPSACPNCGFDLETPPRALFQGADVRCGHRDVERLPSSERDVDLSE